MEILRKLPYVPLSKVLKLHQQIRDEATEKYKKGIYRLKDGLVI